MCLRSFLGARALAGERDLERLTPRSVVHHPPGRTFKLSAKLTKLSAKLKEVLVKLTKLSKCFEKDSKCFEKLSKKLEKLLKSFARDAKAHFIPLLSSSR